MALGKLRPGKRGQVFHDGIIALVELWACLHDRPTCWACADDNWHGRCPFSCFQNLPP
jgi:hypothetical protein